MRNVQAFFPSLSSTLFLSHTRAMQCIKSMSKMRDDEKKKNELCANVQIASKLTINKVSSDCFRRSITETKTQAVLFILHRRRRKNKERQRVRKTRKVTNRQTDKIETERVDFVMAGIKVCFLVIFMTSSRLFGRLMSFHHLTFVRFTALFCRTFFFSLSLLSPSFASAIVLAIQW